MSFEDLGLAPFLLRALAEQGYENPTPIQQQAIPLVLEGHDLLAGAQTGTGKTAAFGLPLLQHLATSAQEVRNGARRPRALILTPTRELATQVHDSLRGYSKYLRIPSTCIYGGVGMGNQLDILRRGVDLLVACPGRLIDHLERRSVDLSGIEVLILDEADRMLDMGFLPSIKRILAKLPKQNRQTLLFSATFADPIKQLALEFMRNPEQIQVTPKNTVAETITHRVHPVDGSRKRDLLLHLLAQDSREQTLVFARTKQKRQVLSNMLADEAMRSVIVFARTKHGADRVTKDLERDGFEAAVIHGNKSQNARQRALNDFRDGSVRILVATDIAARGIDVPGISHVVNFDLPDEAESYVHRIGRTGRNGRDGVAVTLVDPSESAKLRQVERIIRAKLPVIADHLGSPDPVRNPAEKHERNEAATNDNVRRDAKRPNGGNRNNGKQRFGAKPAGERKPGAEKPFRGNNKRRFGGKKPARHAA